MKLSGQYLEILRARWKVGEVSICGPPSVEWRGSLSSARSWLARDDRVDHDALRTRLFQAFAVQSLPAAVATTTVLGCFIAARIVFLLSSSLVRLSYILS